MGVLRDVVGWTTQAEGRTRDLLRVKQASQWDFLRVMQGIELVVVRDPRGRGSRGLFVGWAAGVAMGFKGVVCVSFCCSGQHQETRQTKDRPKAAYEAWHTAWRYPFRARRDWQSQAHLHTTLNKSRDEKLEIVGV